jgi:hypothetical protein
MYPLQVRIKMFRGPGPNGRYVRMYEVFQLLRSTHKYTDIHLMISSNIDNKNRKDKASKKN